MLPTGNVTDCTGRIRNLMGRPNLVQDPLTVATVIEHVAKGNTSLQAASAAGVSDRTVGRIKRATPERLERARQRVAERQMRIVLSDTDRMTQARCDDASNVDSKTGAQSYRAVYEVAQMVGKGPTFIGGDVNVTVLDSSQHVHLANADSAELAARLAALSEQLGT